MPNAPVVVFGNAAATRIAVRLHGHDDELGHEAALGIALAATDVEHLLGVVQLDQCLVEHSLVVRPLVPKQNIKAELTAGS